MTERFEPPQNASCLLDLAEELLHDLAVLAFGELGEHLRVRQVFASCGSITRSTERRHVPTERVRPVAVPLCIAPKELGKGARAQFGCGVWTMAFRHHLDLRSAED